jgi:magnesium chelatase subunit ChlI-like protein
MAPVDRTRDDGHTIGGRRRGQRHSRSRNRCAPIARRIVSLDGSQSSPGKTLRSRGAAKGALAHRFARRRRRPAWSEASAPQKDDPRRGLLGPRLHVYEVEPCGSPSPAVGRPVPAQRVPAGGKLPVGFGAAEVPALTSGELLAAAPGEASAVVRERVPAARERQRERGALNALLSNAALRGHCALEAPGTRLIADAVDRGGMSARAVRRCLRVARTIADLADEERVSALRIAEALQYRAYEGRRFVARQTKGAPRLGSQPAGA